MLRICCILLFGSMLLGCSNSSFNSRSKVPNIILIMADDLGYGDLACYGNTEISTPNLDQMAAEGVRLTDYHSNGPICSPTRAALMTGRYQQRAGIDAVISAANHRHAGMALEEITIAERLEEAGYATAIFGKWHLGYPNTFNPFHQGFEVFRGYVSGNVDYHSHIDQAGYADWWRDTTLVPEQGYVTDLLTKHATRFIHEHQNRPFFLYLSHQAPHYPYQGKNDPADRKVGSTFPVHGSRADVGMAYKEMIEELDRGVGEILKTIKEVNLDQQTLVVFMSDNGATRIGNNGVLNGQKGSLLEGGHRVPAIIRWPGKLLAGTVYQKAVMSMDWYPSFLAIAGIPTAQSNSVDGMDILTPLLASEALPERSLFWHFKEMRAMREGAWKLIHNTRNGEYQLYNLQKEISEKTDLKKQYPERASRMLEALGKWEEEVKSGVQIIN